MLIYPNEPSSICQAGDSRFNDTDQGKQGTQQGSPIDCLSGGHRRHLICDRLQADVFAGQHHRYPKTDRTGHQGGKFAVDHGQEHIRDDTGQYAQVNEQQVGSNLPPINHEAQGHDRDDQRGRGMDDSGFLSDGHELGSVQPQLTKPIPGGCSHGAEGHRDRIHYEGQYRNRQGFKPQPDQNGTGNGRRRAESAGAFDHEGKCPADDHQLRHTVGTDLIEPAIDDRLLAR